MTAQRREQSIQEVPVSVTAYTAADLESRGAVELSDLAQSSANVSFNDVSVGQLVRIRGVGSYDIFAFFDPGVGIYVDGVYKPRMHDTDLDLVGIERVEILRGPQGTLFGRNTIGGAISLTTSRPSDQFKGLAELTVGDFNRQDGKLSVEGPLVPGSLNGRIAGVIRTRDGYGRILDFDTGETIGEQSNVNRYALRASLDWTPKDDVNVVLTADLSSADEKGTFMDLVKTFNTATVALVNLISNPDYNDQYLTPDLYSNYQSPQLNYKKEDGWGLALNVTWGFGETTLKSITSYQDQKVQNPNDFDGSPLQLFDQYPLFEDATYLAQELQLTGTSMRDRLEWVSGLYYGKEKSSWGAYTLLFQPLYTVLGIDASAHLQSWTDNWNAAAYGQGTYKITDKLSMTAGARYSYDSKSVARERERINTGVTYVPYATLGKSWSAWSGRFGFEYQWSPDVMTYASAARGFKSGGINGSSANSLDLLPFDPEYLVNYELGLRSDWLEQRLRFNASVFYSDYTDMQFRIIQIDPSGAIIQIVDNVAKSEIKGAEIELTAIPISGLRLTASIGYLDPAYTEAKPGTLITTDMKFPDVAKWSTSVSGEYTHSLPGGAQVSGRVDYSHFTKMQRTVLDNPDLAQPAYSMVNARLSFTSASGQWGAAVFGTNLTDEEIMTFGSDLSSATAMQAEYCPPRMWGVTLTYNF